MGQSGRRLAASAAAAVCVGAALLPCAARADGDPASDVLVYTNAYLPASAPTKAAAAALESRVAAVYAAGDRIKVAVIAARYDLGAIPSLFDKPAPYAQFLGEELAGIYVGPLLIVMPNGYGIYDGGRSTSAESAVLATLPNPSSPTPDALTNAASAAIAALLAHDALASPDILPPLVELTRASAVGKVLTLRYYLYDDSGRAAATLELLRGTTVLRTALVPAHPTNLNRQEARRLTLPAGASAAGTRACVEAADPTGNKSQSCHSVAVRRRPTRGTAGRRDPSTRQAGRRRRSRRGPPPPQATRT
jgi:hypothetical protein